MTTDIQPNHDRLPATPWPSPSDWPAFARAAQTAPILDAAEEQRLIAAVQDHHDRAAAWQIIAAHLRLVVASVRRHRGYGVPPGDLAQEGVVGLMKALRGFKAALGVRFAAYAASWVDAEIREHVFRNARIVRLSGTRSLRRLFFGYRRTRAALGAQGADRDARVTPAQIAAALDVPEADVHAAIGYFGGHDLALDAQDADHNDGHPSPPAIATAEPDPAQRHEDEHDRAAMSAALQHAIASLPERDRLIVLARQTSVPPESLADLGFRLGVSAERIRQIEQRALTRIRAHMVSVHPEWAASPRRLLPPPARDTGP